VWGEAWTWTCRACAEGHAASRQEGVGGVD